MKKKLATMLLAVAMAVSLLSLSACGGTGETTGPDGSETPKQSDTLEVTETPETPYIPEGDVLASGEAGESVTWSFYSGGTLVISGTGPMKDYTYDFIWDSTGHIGDDVPWGSYYDQIHTVILNDGVTSIGLGAFAHTSLTSVSISDSVTYISDVAFKGCSSLTSVSIGNSVTSIGYCAFDYCTGLTSVTIPDSVISIEDGAFYHCSSLTSVVIGNGVTDIGEAAFADCENLTSVTIPVSVTNIGKRAFEECCALTDVYYGGSEAQWNQIVFEHGPTDEPVWAPTEGSSPHPSAPIEGSSPQPSAPIQRIGDATIHYNS